MKLNKLLTIIVLFALLLSVITIFIFIENDNFNSKNTFNRNNTYRKTSSNKQNSIYDPNDDYKNLLYKKDKLLVHNYINISGNILNTDNLPLLNISYYILNEIGNIVIKGTSDTNGYFECTIIKSDKYHLIIINDNYLPYYKLIKCISINHYHLDKIELMDSGYINLYINTSDNHQLPTTWFHFVNESNDILFGNIIKLSDTMCNKINNIDNKPSLNIIRYPIYYSASGFTCKMPVGNYSSIINIDGFPSVQTNYFNIIKGKTTNLTINLPEYGKINGVCKGIEGSFKSDIKIVACPLKVTKYPLKEGYYKYVDKLEIPNNDLIIIAEPLITTTDNLGLFSFRNVPYNIWYSIYLKRPSTVRRLKDNVPTIFAKAGGEDICIIVEDLPILLLEILNNNITEDSGNVYIKTIHNDSVYTQKYILKDKISLLPLNVKNIDDDIGIKIDIIWGENYYGNIKTILPKGYNQIKQEILLTPCKLYYIKNLTFILSHYTIIGHNNGKILVSKNDINNFPYWYFYPFKHVIISNSDSMYSLLSDNDIVSFAAWSDNFNKMKYINYNNHDEFEYIKEGKIEFNINNYVNKDIYVSIEAKINKNSESIWDWNIKVDKTKCHLVITRPLKLNYDISYGYYDNNKYIVVNKLSLFLDKSNVIEISIY